MSVLTLMVEILSILFSLIKNMKGFGSKLHEGYQLCQHTWKKARRGTMVGTVIITTNLHIQLNYIVCIFSNILKQSNYYKIDFSWYFSKLDKIKKYIRLNSTLLLYNFLNLWFLFLNVCVIFLGVLEYNIQILC